MGFGDHPPSVGRPGIPYEAMGKPRDFPSPLEPRRSRLPRSSTAGRWNRRRGGGWSKGFYRDPLTEELRRRRLSGGHLRSPNWLVLVKPCLAAAPASLDLRCYAASHQGFPNQSTLDQFFDDQQWESYRLLGQLTGEALLRRPT